MSVSSLFGHEGRSRATVARVVVAGEITWVMMQAGLIIASGIRVDAKIKEGEIVGQKSRRRAGCVSIL